MPDVLIELGTAISQHQRDLKASGLGGIFSSEQVVEGVIYETRNIDLLPSITYPQIGVRLTAPGISPEVAIS